MIGNQGEDDLSVNESLNLIVSLERRGRTHAYSGVETTKFKDDHQSHHLDYLTRLMTSNETCVAVCEINGELLVALAIIKIVICPNTTNDFILSVRSSLDFYI